MVLRHESSSSSQKKDYMSILKKNTLPTLPLTLASDKKSWLQDKKILDMSTEEHSQLTHAVF